jgi:hypothetical protein
MLRYAPVMRSSLGVREKHARALRSHRRLPLKCALGILRSMIDAKWFVGGFVVVALAFGTGTLADSPKDDLSKRKSDWDQIKRRTAVILRPSAHWAQYKMQLYASCTDRHMF